MLRSEQSRQVVQPAKQNYLLYCHDADADNDREADADVHAGAANDDADADCEDVGMMLIVRIMLMLFLHLNSHLLILRLLVPRPESQESPAALSRFGPRVHELDQDALKDVDCFRHFKRLK